MTRKPLCDSRPDVLLITLDECRADALGCYGGTVVQTPHVDGLAAAGTRFAEAFTASPLCLPSRCSILSGQVPHHHGSYSNFRDRRPDPALPNLYNLLRGSGYRTAHIGKCHYTAAPYSEARAEATLDREPVDAYLRSLGLDHLELCNGKWNSIWFWNDYSRELESAGHLAAYRALAWRMREHHMAFAFPGPEEWHPDAWVGRKSVAWLEQTACIDAPRFLWCSFSGPHYPHDPPAAWLERVDRSRLPLLRLAPGEFDDQAGKIQRQAWDGSGRIGELAEGASVIDGGTRAYTRADWIRIQAHYHANVAFIDHWIGKVLKAAHASRREVLVVVTADHGDCMGAHGLWGKNRCAYDEVLRVPLVVAGPGFAVGMTSSTRVGLIDLLPTLCHSAASASPPGRDGRALQDSLVDGGHTMMTASCEDLLIAHDRRWKLVIDRRLGIEELYDREQDPGEYVNVINHPATQEARCRLMKTLLAELMASGLG